MWKSAFAVLAAAVLLIGCGQTRGRDGGGPFQLVVIDSMVTNPMEIAIADDGRVFIAERGGALKVWVPKLDTTYTAGFFPASATLNDGLLGLALDPNFNENGWIYIHYSPLEGPPRNRVSRLSLRGHHVRTDSEVVMLEWPTQRDDCCHAGGSMAFGPNGDLYVGTGDNTFNGADEFYSPIDERPGWEISDAQRTAGNTNDLRGSILRIHPLPDGSYEIPEGNLFPVGTPKTRPEIYVMGVRNAYRLTVDLQTGMLVWGDVGPGAPEGHPYRGPEAHDELNVALEAGNYGWPYFLADNKPYMDRDFATGELKALFDPDEPRNDSPNNTGLRELPPARPATIWYARTESDEFPGLGEGGQTIIAGPLYRYNPETVHPNGLPERFDGQLLFADWMRNWIKTTDMDSQGRIGEIGPFLEEFGDLRVMDLEVARDGRLYAIDWGQSYFGFNLDARIVRIDYHDSSSPSRQESRPAPETTTPEPAVTFSKPEHGTIFDWDTPIEFELSQRQTEMDVEMMLLCDSHVHHLDTVSAEAGAVTIPMWPLYIGYTIKRNQVAVLDARSNIDPSEPILGKNRLILQPRRKEAEHFSRRNIAERSFMGPVRDQPFAQSVMDVEDESFLAYEPVNLKGIAEVNLRVKPELGGRVEVRLDDVDGKLLGTADVDSTTVRAHPAIGPPVVPAGAEPPAIEGWADVSFEIQDPGGAHTLFFVFHDDVEATRREREGEKGILMRVDWIDFVDAGPSDVVSLR